MKGVLFTHRTLMVIIKSLSYKTFFAKEMFVLNLSIFAICGIEEVFIFLIIKTYTTIVVLYFVIFLLWVFLFNVRSVDFSFAKF